MAISAAKPFVPRGHVLLANVVPHIVRHLEGDLVVSVSMHQAELRALERKAMLDDIAERSRATRRSRANMVRPSVSPEHSRRPVRSSTLSEQDYTRLGELRREKSLLDRIEELITASIRQDLGEGVVEAIAITSWGQDRRVPQEAWRNQYGVDAIAGAELVWWEPVLLTKYSGMPLIAEEDAANWLSGFAAATKNAGVLVQVQKLVVDGKPVPRQASPDEMLEPEVAAPRAIRRRTVVPQAKADQWMLTVATTAKHSGKLFGRNLGIAQCMDDLNCTRDVAGAAYKALPDELKQPRGKPPKAAA